MDPRLSANSDRDLLRARVRLELENGRLDTAHQLLELLRGLGDEHPTTLLLTATWLVASKRPNDALELLDKIVEGARAAEHSELRTATEAWRDQLRRELGKSQ